MKKATCRDLRGVCDVEFIAETPEEMGNKVKKHALEMIMQGDAAHNQAAAEMMALSKEEQMQWYEQFKNTFDSLPDA